MKSFKKHKINKRTNKIKKAEEVNKLLDYDEESEFSEDLQIRQMRQELRRVKYNYRFVSALYSTIGTMLVVAAIAVLIANLWLPVLQVTGASMSPTLEEGQVLLANKGSNLETGDIIAFYYNNKILVKRVIAVAGDWVYIDETGKVYVNDIAIDEPYLTDKALGNCNIEMPYQVPESQIFVMGDHRSVSLDSRNTTIGCISEEQILGKVYYCLWPVESLGKIK
ncbi:MAG: signal peptidase I [Agathobacter sp.]|nr:signal peptidase I [Agathobacter sp.]